MSIRSDSVANWSWLFRLSVHTAMEWLLSRSEEQTTTQEEEPTPVHVTAPTEAPG